MEGTEESKPEPTAPLIGTTCKLGNMSHAEHDEYIQKLESLLMDIKNNRTYRLLSERIVKLEEAFRIAMDRYEQLGGNAALRRMKERKGR